MDKPKEETGFTDERTGEWIAGLRGVHRERVHNRLGYRIRVERRERKRFQQIRRNDLRDHLHRIKRGHEEKGDQTNRHGARQEERGRADRTSARNEDKSSDRRHASDKKKQWEPSQRGESSRQGEIQSQKHRDRSPLMGEMGEPSRRSEGSRLETRPFWSEETDQNDRKTLSELEERISRLRLEEEDLTRRDCQRKQKEEEELRRREFRDEMEKWDAKYEREKKEMEKWQQEREDDRKAREEDNSLERFKQAMAEMLQPFLKKSKKRKNMK